MTPLRYRGDARTLFASHLQILVGMESRVDSFDFESTELANSCFASVSDSDGAFRRK